MRSKTHVYKTSDLNNYTNDVCNMPTHKKTSTHPQNHKSTQTIRAKNQKTTQDNTSMPTKKSTQHNEYIYQEKNST